MERQRAARDRSKTVVEVGYSGSHGANLVRQVFSNGRVAQETADGRLFVAPGTPLAQPNFGRMRYRVSDATSDYNGLTVGLNRRLSSGLQAQVSYTFSKSQDDGAAALGGNDFTNESAGSRYLLTKDRGLSPFDVRHSLVANVNYLLPFAANATGIKAILAKGWNVSTLIRLRSGYPFSRVLRRRHRTAGTGLGARVSRTSRPARRPTRCSAPSTTGSIPTAFMLPATGFIGTLPRNTIIGPDSGPST